MGQGEISAEVEDLTKKLVAIRSVSPSAGEVTVVEELEDYLEARGVDVIRDSPFAELGDEYGRRNLYAQVRGQGKGCLILSGHVDVVDATDERFVARTEGDYLYGRGAVDMKSGLAACAVTLSRFNAIRDSLHGNLLFVAVCDEENASAGVLKAVEFLRDYRDREQVEYLGFINTDYTTPYREEDKNHYVYLGTIGKLLPTILVNGATSHVGEPFRGLPANLLAAEIHRRIEMKLNELVMMNPSSETTTPVVGPVPVRTLPTRSRPPTVSIRTMDGSASAAACLKARSSRASIESSA